MRGEHSRREGPGQRPRDGLVLGPWQGGRAGAGGPSQDGLRKRSLGKVYEDLDYVPGAVENLWRFLSSGVM